MFVFRIYTLFQSFVSLLLIQAANNYYYRDFQMRKDWNSGIYRDVSNNVKRTGYATL